MRRKIYLPKRYDLCYPQINMMSRAKWALAAWVCLLLVLSSHSALAKKSKKKPSPPPIIVLEHLTTHHKLELQPQSGGGFSKRKMQEVSSFLRCHHTGQRHSMNERLVKILYQVARHYHNAKLFIVAGYRAPKIAKQKGNPRSPHKRGVAADFQVQGESIESVRDHLRSAYHNIGVGYYPNSGFIHVDVGRQKDAFWIDYSGPGEKARYTPPALRRKRASQVAESGREDAASAASDVAQDEEAGG